MWRYQLKEGDDVDFLKSDGEWETGVITYIDAIDGGLFGSPEMEIGFRMFKDGQSTLRKKKQKIAVFSIRVQKPHTMQSQSCWPEHLWSLDDDYSWPTEFND